MNNQVLRKNKIDAKYVLSRNKFLCTFGYLCLTEDIIENDSFNKKELYYLLEQSLIPVAQEEITYENVARGDVILVGRPNSFNAFLRPKLKIETKKDSSHHIKRVKPNFSKEETIEDLSLTQLLIYYRENIDNEIGQEYFEELINRLHEFKCNEVQNRKNYVKVYKRNRHAIDKK